MVHLICTHVDGLTEQAKLTQRIQAIEARAALCHRQESRRRRPRYHIRQEEVDASLGDLAEERTNHFLTFMRAVSSSLKSGLLKFLRLARVDFTVSSKSLVMMGKWSSPLSRSFPSLHVTIPTKSQMQSPQVVGSQERV